MLWRETMRPARFFMIDARAFGIVLLGLLNIFSLWTWIICGGVVLLFIFIERRGLSVPAALRGARMLLAGRRRPKIPWWKMRRIVDYGGW